MTYRVFCETFDEPAHVAAGMEWLDRGTYTVDKSHPPLARIAAAIGPRAVGLHYVRTGYYIGDGNAIFYAQNRYLRNLTLARIGILPFFVLAIVIVGAWARALWGDVPGVVAAALFANEPTVLAHAGLATTDMAAAALTVTAGYAFWRWLNEPRPRSAVFFGVALGLAFLAKFSTLLFVPLVLGAVLLCHVASGNRLESTRSAIQGVVIAVVVAGLLVWAGYRFSIADFFDGMRMVRAHAVRGHWSSLFGQFRQTGWWYYFPLCLGVKSTLGFLALALVGCVVSIRAGGVRAAPLLAAILILLAVLPTTINIGVRHVLPIYPFLAIVTGGALTFRPPLRRSELVVLGFLALLPSLSAHPDYLPYFNALAGSQPERIFTDSNLDWGQDLLRVPAAMQRYRIDRIGLAYGGNADPTRHNIPNIAPVDPYHYTEGWIAISEVLYRSLGPEYRWLQLFQPVGHIGKSIRLYHLPPAEELLGSGGFARPAKPELRGTR